MNRTFSKCTLLVSLCCLSIAGLAQTAKDTLPVTLQFDRKNPSLNFAAQEIRRALTDKAIKVVERNLEEAANDGIVIVLTESREAAAKWQVAPLKFNDTQSYAIRARTTVKQRIYVVLGADAPPGLVAFGVATGC